MQIFEVEESRDIREDEKRIRRKLSRSATIIEEMESKMPSDSRIEAQLESEKWSTVSQPVKDFTMDCAHKYATFFAQSH